MVAIAGTQAAKTQAPSAKRPIQVHLDMAVDPKREQEMLTNFEKIFRPVAQRQPYAVRQTMTGRPAPTGGKNFGILLYDVY